MRETNVDWIFQGPACAVLIINLIFLCRIMWVRVKYNFGSILHIFNYSFTFDQRYRTKLFTCFFFFFFVHLHCKICISFIIPNHTKRTCYFRAYSIDNNFLFWFRPLFRYLLRNYVQRTHWKLVSIERQQRLFSYSYHCLVLLIWWLWLGRTKVWVVTFLP